MFLRRDKMETQICFRNKDGIDLMEWLSIRKEIFISPIVMGICLDDEY
jgi:hypothetical protein